MTMSAPVKSVVHFLTENGYQLFPGPLVVAGVQFMFPAVLTGPERSSDLVLVVDTLEVEDNEEIIRQVLGVARALDVARAHNPLTSVIVGTRPDQKVISELMSVSRVLSLGSMAPNEDERTVSKWLAVLTPLDLDKGTELGIDPMEELREQVSSLQSNVADIAATTVRGPGDVEKAMNTLLERDLEDVGRGDE